MMPNLVNKFTALTGLRFYSIEVEPCSTRYRFPGMTKAQVEEIREGWKQIAELNTDEECLCCTLPSDNAYYFTVVTRQAHKIECFKCGSPKCKRCQVRKNNERYEAAKKGN